MLRTSLETSLSQNALSISDVSSDNSDHNNDPHNDHVNDNRLVSVSMDACTPRNLVSAATSFLTAIHVPSILTPRTHHRTNLSSPFHSTCSTQAQARTHTHAHAHIDTEDEVSRVMQAMQRENI